MLIVGAKIMLIVITIIISVAMIAVGLYALLPCRHHWRYTITDKGGYKYRVCSDCGKIQVMVRGVWAELNVFEEGI
jgi:hypothetical protein